MTFPHPVKAVVFDMDGLLFDTERLYAEVMTATAAEMGGVLTPEVILRVVGLPASVCEGIWADHFGPEFDVGSFRFSSYEKFEEAARTRLSLKPGVVELLDRLDALRLPRAIATSTARPLVDAHLSHAGIASRFHAIVAYGDYARGKPHPEPYLLAAERLDVDARYCLALEDSPNGVRSASAAGMMTIMVPDMVEPSDEMHQRTFRIVEDLHGVCRLLR